MGINVGKATKELIRKGLCHFTKSDLLYKIILKDGISMRASCIKAYWKDEENPYDDNQEVKGLMQLYDSLEFNLREPRNHHRLACGESVAQKVSPKPTIISTTTPYIICFSCDPVDEHMYHKFSNPALGYPVMLKFNTEAFLKNSSGRDSENDEFQASELKIESEELMKVFYTSTDETYEKEDAQNTWESALKELRSGKADSEDDEDKIDATFYVKRGRYSDEKEVRYILRVNDPSAFGLTSEGQFIFQTQRPLDNKSRLRSASESTNEDDDSHIYVRFSPDCLEEVVFEEETPDKVIEEYQEHIASLPDFKHVIVRKFKTEK